MSKARKFPWDGIGVAIGIGICMFGIVCSSLTSKPTRPIWTQSTEAPVYERLRTSRTGRAWAVCSRGDAILRGFCTVSEGSHVLSEPVSLDGRLGWACEARVPVVARARCFGPQQPSWSSATDPIAAAWSVVTTTLTRMNGTSWDYYQWRNGLDNCLDAIEPELP